MSRIPVQDGYFTVEPPVRLIGSRCTACEEVFFPQRHVCARCLADGCESQLLGPGGLLWTWTWVHVPLFAQRDARIASYGVGQVDLPEGPRVQGIITGGRDALEIGMAMELDLEVLATTDEGDEVVIFRFAPVIS